MKSTDTISRALEARHSLAHPVGEAVKPRTGGVGKCQDHLEPQRGRHKSVASEIAVGISATLKNVLPMILIALYHPAGARTQFEADPPFGFAASPLYLQGGLNSGRAYGA
jgi:hypothetical protein